MRSMAGVTTGCFLSLVDQISPINRNKTSSGIPGNVFDSCCVAPRSSPRTRFFCISTSLLRIASAASMEYDWARDTICISREAPALSEEAEAAACSLCSTRTLRNTWRSPSEWRKRGRGGNTYFQLPSILFGETRVIHSTNTLNDRRDIRWIDPIHNVEEFIMRRGTREREGKLSNGFLLSFSFELRSSWKSSKLSHFTIVRAYRGIFAFSFIGLISMIL